jgi:hypothetical protein
MHQNQIEATSALDAESEYLVQQALVCFFFTLFILLLAGKIDGK